jgi:hypothetical protein
MWWSISRVNILLVSDQIESRKEKIESERCVAERTYARYGTIDWSKGFRLSAFSIFAFRLPILSAVN